MTSPPAIAAQPLAAPAVPPPTSSARALVPLFAAAIFINALLLFLIQPMFGKMVLPLLGGAPAVWNTCMLFFQGALLAGYLYAHLGARYLSPWRLAALHLALLALTLYWLPITAPDATPPVDGVAPALWLLSLLTLSIGLPFTLLAAGSPLLQHLFARSGHQAAGNPYVLYAASNAGSLVAVLAYPLLVEPLFRVQQQSWLWAAGYVALGALIGLAALRARQSAHAAPLPHADPGQRSDEAPAEPHPVPIRWSDRGRWLALAFAPSSLLLGITTYITTDVAAVPLLWILPLGVYLLTFILAFSDRPLISHGRVVRLLPVALLSVGAFLFWDSPPRGIGLVLLPVVGFFVLALACHGELYARRPAPAALTEFYLFVAIGGMLGGMFNVLVAPLLFTTTLEFPIALAVVAFLAPRNRAVSASRLWPVLASFLVLLVALALEGPTFSIASNRYLAMGMTAVMGAVLVRMRHHPVMLGVALTGILVAGEFRNRRTDIIMRDRSFFGVHNVRRVPVADVFVHLFQHGRTLHGAQQPDSAFRRTPLTYYHPNGPLGEVFTALHFTSPEVNVAAIGLGVGSVAAYARPADRWTIYEIDPLVERMARDTTLFTYLADAPIDIPVVIGDGRLSIAREADAAFDLIIVDAFTSDAVPVHLLTREALELYVRKLAPGGRIAFNVSNRYLDLAAVLGVTAHELGYAALEQVDISRQPPSTLRSIQHTSSHWLVLARSPNDLVGLTPEEGWRPVPLSRSARAWTDDYSNLIQALRGRD